ncbi:MAG: DUF2442 domain-containing protein [Bacteroidales bacterium]|nr:DUF2442 domain-containing protein [Bacteroidales bacterium]
MNKVVEIKILDNYIVWLKFEDGFNSQIDLRPFLGKGIAKELLEEDKFKTLDLEEGGGIAWYNGYDFCPNYLRQLTEEK